MEKLKIEREKEDFYILEVNDKGDTIEFDLTDISLPNKIFEACENIKKINKDYQEEILKINQEELDDLEKAKKTMKIEIQKCNEMRKTFDGFLGENACQKIFGDKNYYGMFPQLFEALEPHFSKMKIKQEKAKKKLIQKYMPNNSDVM